MKSNIIFMGTPDFALPTLKKLTESHKVNLVICQPDKSNRRGKKIEIGPIKKYAMEQGLEIFQPYDVNSAESIDYIKKFSADYIVVVAYGQIIKKEIRDYPKKNIVNIHASLLPKYRGAAPINWAIINREKESGISIMKVDKGLDKGEVYLTDKTDVANKSYPELYEELSLMGAKLLIDYIEKDSLDLLIGTPQNDEEATYAEKVTKEIGLLDFKDVHETLGKILGLTPRPGAQCNYLNQIVKLHGAEIIDNTPNGDKSIGEILEVSSDGILVNCGNGTIKITKLQFPGKKILSTREYLAGNEIFRGEILR